MSKVLLCVLDGFGEGPDYEGNAITRANTPVLDRLRAEHPWTLLHASGEAVGIPAGTQGGSEVGHLTMGAGRILLQPLAAIDQSIASGEFMKKPELLAAAKHCLDTGAAFHILGMISDQGVHAHLNHALALLDFAKQQGLTRVYVHGITDGRDVPPKTAKDFVQTLLNHMQQLGVGQLATLMGRFYAMDRDKNADRTDTAYQLLTAGSAPTTATDPLAALDAAYAAGLESDYYLEPILLNPEGLITAQDAVIFFNFRTDRAAQLTEQLLTQLKPHFLAFGAYTTQAPVLFPPPTAPNNLGAVLEAAGKRQLRAAETEKYAHVTFFFNTQIKDPFPHEDRLIVESLKCDNYEDAPDMKAREVTQQLLTKLQEGYDFVALNYANLDLVGHSGNYQATVQAVETIDECLGQLLPAARAAGYTVLITGDHGNAEYMKYEDGSPCPSHTRNPVPLHLIGEPELAFKNASNTAATGGLQDLAPSILTLMGLPIPSEMTGSSLV